MGTQGPFAEDLRAHHVAEREEYAEQLKELLTRLAQENPARTSSVSASQVIRAIQTMDAHKEMVDIEKCARSPIRVRGWWLMKRGRVSAGTSREASGSGRRTSARTRWSRWKTFRSL